MKPAKKRENSPDWVLLALTCVILVFGCVILYSASALVAEGRFGDQYYFVKKQVVWALLGLAALLFAQRMNLEFLQKNARVLFFGVLVLLAVVLVAGHEVGGSRRWLRVLGIGFQPSEFAKLALVVMLADYLDRKKSKLGSFWQGFLPPIGLLGVVTVLIALEPDLGTPMLITMVGVGMIFMAGGRLSHLLLMALAAAPFLYMELFHVSYRRQRILAFLDPWGNPQGTGYQLIQSFLALGSGGFWGRGSGESTMKLYYLPEAQTDFIFSILGEELGFLGGFALICLFAFLAQRSFRIAAAASNYFETFLAAGISLLLSGQVLINLCVVTGLLPTKGIPLPFISFGGSSLVLALASVGLLLNVSRRSGRPAAAASSRKR